MTKCKYIKTCEWYEEGNFTCEKDGGMYYGYDSPAGCWVTNYKKEEKEKCKKKI